jgi:hypothetical protein
MQRWGLLSKEHARSIVRDDFAQVQYGFRIGCAERSGIPGYGAERGAASQSCCCSGPDLVAWCARVCAAADARPNGDNACCAAYWHRPVHARGVLSTRSAHHVVDDSSADIGVARVFVIPVIYMPHNG